MWDLGEIRHVCCVRCGIPCEGSQVGLSWELSEVEKGSLVLPFSKYSCYTENKG